MGVTISLDRIECVDGEDFMGADEVYYVSMLGCEAESGGTTEPETPMPVGSRSRLVHTTRSRALVLNDGDSAHFPPEDRTLFPNPAIPDHRGACDADAYVLGPIYFFDLDQERDQHSPRGHVVSGVVIGHVLGAAAVVLGLMIGGTEGAVFGTVLFLGSMLAGAATVHRLLELIDRDDYLGGYRFSVPVSGPEHEVISFDLVGSEDGISTDDGTTFSRTAGTVLYRVTARVDRDPVVSEAS